MNELAEFLHEMLASYCINDSATNYNHWAVRHWLLTLDQGELLQDAICIAGGHGGLNYMGQKMGGGATLDAIARQLVQRLPERTPDGVLISYASIRAAIRGLS